MEDARGAAATSAGDVLEEKVAGTAPDAVPEVACIHGDAGDAATAASMTVTGAATTVVDLVEKEVAGSNLVVPELEVNTSSGTVHAGAQASDEQVVKEEEDTVGNKTKLAMTGLKDRYDPDFVDDDIYECNSGDDVDDGNVDTFVSKEVQKIKDQGRLPTTRERSSGAPIVPLSQSLRMGSLSTLCLMHGMHHSGEDVKMRAQHASLLKALTPD
ncbi:hypothetical protein VPH35_090602 [Triticum aestivum]